MTFPVVGDKIPNLPERYYEEKDSKPSGIALLMQVSNCPQGFVIFVRDSTIVAVVPIEMINAMPDASLYDAIIMNSHDIPAGAVEKAAAEVHKHYS